MKKISNKQSRRNIARRQRKVAARHAQAGHWDAQPQPMFNTGTVHYEVGVNTDAMSFGGIAAVHRMVTKLGLPQSIDAHLELLKRHLPYHESDHVLNLAYNVLCGGMRLEDIELLRHDTAYMNALGADLIPDPTTAGDYLRRFKTVFSTRSTPFETSGIGGSRSSEGGTRRSTTRSRSARTTGFRS